VNLYVRSRATARLKGETFAVAQETDYPWSGAVRVKISKAPAAETALHLRIPGWSESAEFRVNAKPVKPAIDKGYATLDRHWAEGDTVEVAFPMEVQRIEANPRVAEDRGRVALRRGPMIYCLEQADQPVDLDRLVLAGNAKFESHFEAGLLGGVSVITGTAMAKPAVNWDDALYHPLRGGTPATFRAVPYAAWGNRGPGKMAVWIGTGN
jgi:uncharacterized protein